MLHIMALAPKFAGLKLSAAPAPQTLHTFELYLDYVCPFSSKMFKTVYNDVFPIIEKKYATTVQFLFRPQIQPWHPSSTLTHEAGIAVLKLDPSKFWPFSAALMADQKAYFDVNVVKESRNETYARLARLAASVGVDEKKVLDLLVVSDTAGADGSLNIGNKVTDDLKVLVKMARLVGVHVSPTVILDGVVENSISSSWTAEQWEEFIEKRGL